jgi:hypothetical protein
MIVSPNSSRVSAAFIAFGALLASFTQLSSAVAQPVEHGAHVRDPLRPRVGLISNEVAVQRLRVAGVRNSVVVGRDSNRILIQGTLRGRRALLSMDATSGVTVLANNPRQVIIPRGAALNPLVTGRQVPVNRARIADPRLMRAVETPR